MTSAGDTSWFYWSLGVMVVLPVGLVVLTELHHALARRGSILARSVSLIRNYILPLGALLVLLVKGNQVAAAATPVRTVATVFSFMVLYLLVSGLNATLFQGAPKGTWRGRMPSIFLDVARFALIAVGLALILSYIWGANVGGLVTALGLSSIVLGLALQNSVGQIFAGLFMLFEQPFQIGDWIDIAPAPGRAAVRGRVVEVNWRATHIHSDDGLHIMPNSVLAATSFTSLSRPSGAHWISVRTVFSSSDPPDEVCRLLTRIAGTLPQLRTDALLTSAPTGGIAPTCCIASISCAGYSTFIPLNSAADDDAAKATFLRWIWYAARRADLHLDAADDDFATPERVENSLRIVASTLRLNQVEQQEMLPQIRITRYGAAETIQFSGEVPQQITFIVSGRVGLTVNDEDGSIRTVRTLEEGDYLGQTTLTREPVTLAARALEETTVLQIKREHIEQLVQRKPLLMQDIGREIDKRTEEMQRAVAAIGHRDVR